MESTLNLTALIEGAEETARSIREDYPNTTLPEITRRLMEEHGITMEPGRVAASFRKAPGEDVTITFRLYENQDTGELLMEDGPIEKRLLRLVLHHIGLTLTTEPVTLSTTIDPEAVAFAQAKLAPVGEAFVEALRLKAA